MKTFVSRLRVVKIFFGIVFLIFVIRLVDLQLINGRDYLTQANAQQQKKSVLPARRGKILVRKNLWTDEAIPLATNNTQQTLFIDPLILTYPRYNPNKSLEEQKRGNPDLAAEVLAPILIHAHCEKVESCVIETDPESWTETQRIAISQYTKELKQVFSEPQKRRVVLMTDIAEERGKEILNLGLSGIKIKNSNVVADPVAIGDPGRAAGVLSPLLGIGESQLERLLQKSFDRYKEVVYRIVPEVSALIWELKADPEYREILRGVQLVDEHRRFYPEKKLGSQILGFVDAQGNGQYGLEGYFDQELRGKEGLISGATNTKGQRIFGKDLGIQRAEDGVDIVLSIDRLIQGEVEQILEEDLEKFQADSVQAVVLEPDTGRILAMVNVPTFDPNRYGEIFDRYEIPPEQEEEERESEEFNQRIPTIREGNQFYRYFNTWGPEVFKNKVVTDSYEPGSVIKAVTMAVALNGDEISPQTTYQDTGAIEVDEFEIRNSDEVYAGVTSMIEVLNRSLNTGIAFITRKMGPQLFYEALKSFGFGEYTDVDFPGEVRGQLEHWSDWEESELITRGYGQGFSANILQVGLAFGALANGGYLMKPLLIEEIRHPDGEVEEYKSERVRRVISEESSQTIRAMLLSAVQRGTGRGARVKGYSVMGKTGTSQTYKNGKAQTGLGTTIASFAGFAPMDDPKFVVIVKYDYPKLSQWGSETAAISFRKIAEFLFDYMKIPPDR